MAAWVLSDAAFALDSATAVLSVTRTTFVAVTASVLATTALRGWFPMLATVEKLRVPRIALCALLAVVVIKLFVHVPPAVFRVVIVLLVGAAGVEATRRPR